MNGRRNLIFFLRCRFTYILLLKKSKNGIHKNLNEMIAKRNLPDTHTSLAYPFFFFNSSFLTHAISPSVKCIIFAKWNSISYYNIGTETKKENSGKCHSSWDRRAVEFVFQCFPHISPIIACEFRSLSLTSALHKPYLMSKFA